MLHNVKESISAQVITRILIISYFIALALGLIPGAEISKIAEPFMSQEMATYAMRLVVFLLAGMVMFGLWRRPAALVLALVVFWSSYISLYSGGDIGSFWRDLALIGGLLLTANIATYADMALAEDWQDEKPQPVDEFADVRARSRDDGFREDFDIARTT